MLNVLNRFERLFDGVPALGHRLIQVLLKPRE
jgi:hypothetical protein